MPGSRSAGLGEGGLAYSFPTFSEALRMLHLRTNRRKTETSEEQDQYPLHTAHVPVIIWWRRGLPSGWDERKEPNFGVK